MAIVATRKVKLARKVQVVERMEVNGDDQRHSSDVDTSHPQVVF
jgi:hypothetical protein